MTEDVLAWVNGLRNDPDFGRAIWDSLIYLGDDPSPVGVNAASVAKFLQWSYLHRTPIP